VGSIEPTNFPSRWTSGDTASQFGDRVFDFLGGDPAPPGVALFRNHSTQIAAIDLFVVPSVTFESLYVFIIGRVDQRNTSSDRGVDHTSNHAGVFRRHIRVASKQELNESHHGYHG
jgi:hypothetical protein